MMVRKSLNQSLWNFLKAGGGKPPRPVTRIWMPPPDDTHDNMQPLKANENYFRLRLAHVSLTGGPHWQEAFRPLVYSSVRLKYGDLGVVNLTRVTMPGGESEADDSNLLPFSGGTVEVACGLIALPREGGALVGQTLEMLNEWSSRVRPPVVEALQVSELLSRSVRTLLTVSGGHTHLTAHEVFTDDEPLKPGYYAIVSPRNEQEEKSDARWFKVKDDRLYYWEESGETPRQVEDSEYLLFQIEAYDEREDWRLATIQEPLDKAVSALLLGQKDEGMTYSALALTTACCSPDLTMTDRRRVVLAVHDELANIGTETRGAVGDAQRDLNEIMGARAVPVAAARRQPQITLAEVIERANSFPWVSTRDETIEESAMPPGDVGRGGDDNEYESVKHASRKKAINPNLMGVGAGSEGAGSAEPNVVGEGGSGAGARPEEPEVTTVTDDGTKKDVVAAKPTPRQRVNAWIAERENEAEKPLVVEQTYTLRFRVGAPRADSLITSAKADLLAAEIPDQGLETTWVITSDNVALAALSPDTSVEVESSPQSWSATFSLRIPKGGESEMRELSIRPLTVQDAELGIVIFARNTMYRQFRVELKVVPTEQPAASSDPAAKIEGDVEHVALKYTGLLPQHEWQTPEGTLNITVYGNGKAGVRGDIYDQNKRNFLPNGRAEWNLPLPKIAGRIQNLRDSAEKFRVKFGNELNDIDRQELDAKLDFFKSNQHTFWEDNRADAMHNDTWDKLIAPSQELFDLAYYGYELYKTFFPNGSKLHGWLDGLLPGWRIDLSWSEYVDSNWVPHVPWGLLYMRPPVQGQPVDPMYFWGLRFRFNYLAHETDSGLSRALGGLQDTAGAYSFYWGDDDQEIVEEVAWQQSEWKDWGNPVFVPDGSLTETRKQQVLALFHKRSPKPTPVLYFFCHCEVGDGNKPVLRFGKTKGPDDNVKQTDLGQMPLEYAPLVFINACTSAAADPYYANELEQTFFERGCRSYIGTEVKVPIRFASRFAKVFYSFFFRDLDPKPIAAGEAIFQARRFLWREYRNIGGLLYAYINMYELYMATEDEVDALHGHS